MKKTYSKPVIEEVNPRLLNVVLGPGIGDWSNGAGDWGHTKEREELEEEEEAVAAQQQNYSLW